LKDNKIAPAVVPLGKNIAKKKHYTLRRTVIMSAIVSCLIAMLSIPVLGYGSVFQMIGHWTAEQFKFGQTSTSPEQASSDKVKSKYASFRTHCVNME
jgi:hypothetical protein